MKEGQKKFRENIFTKSVRAGKRTYYLDVKETKKGERYVTITERKRRYDDDGSYKVEKHKIFLYREDFDEFSEALQEVVGYIQSGNEYSEDTAEDEKNLPSDSHKKDDIPVVEEYTLDSFEDLEG
ncbi:MAG: DUF3276 family protein [Bacteroidota bacterium]|nr:DUF3276 family protein [Bacteroidota bacterium]